MDSSGEKMTTCDVYFSAQVVQDLFPDPFNPSYTEVLEIQFHQYLSIFFFIKNETILLKDRCFIFKDLTNYI